MKRRFPSRKWLGIFVLVIVISPLVGLYLQIDARGNIDQARSVDAIIVLGSAVYPGGRPSPSLRARTLHAVELYRAGYAAHLILSGGIGANPPSEARVMFQIARDADVPADALVLEEAARSTEENLSNSQRVMQARGWTTALIVSDSFHLFRAETIARDLGMQVFISPAVASPASNAPLPRAWYTVRE
ncbi:MAG: YdcF family protein, partial [Chloroflexi bacterium]|nr:YdcF family protein [Chloroflexota bacterium]